MKFGDTQLVIDQLVYPNKVELKLFDMVDIPFPDNFPINAPRKVKRVFNWKFRLAQYRHTEYNTDLLETLDAWNKFYNPVA